MKSLMICQDYFPPQVGGIAHMMSSIAAALGGERVCCLVGVDAAAEAVEQDPPGVRVYRSRGAFHAGRLTKALSLLAIGGRIFVLERPRALQLSTVYDGGVGRRLAGALRVPYLVYAHGNEVLDAMNSPWPGHLRVMRGASAVVANSRFTAQLVERAGVLPSRIRVVHPGCDVERFATLMPDRELRRRLLGDRESGPVVLTVGNLVARKGHDNVIRALASVAASIPDVTYLVVGDGPYRARLDEIARECGVRDRVVFAGRVHGRDLANCYSLCDVFAMPSREDLESADVEGFGIVYIEANAAGKPVIGGRSGGVPDAVLDGETGLLVDPLDPSAIAAALVDVLSDGARARRLGDAGRKRALTSFSWASVALRVHGIVESMVLHRE